MDNQIEEMAILARVFCQTIKEGGCCEKCSKCEEYKMAERFYNAGYHKASDVARKIFDEIDKLTYRYMNDVDYSIGEMVLDIAELKKKYENEA